MGCAAKSGKVSDRLAANREQHVLAVELPRPGVAVVVVGVVVRLAVHDPEQRLRLDQLALGQGEGHRLVKVGVPAVPAVQVVVDSLLGQGESGAIPVLALVEGVVPVLALVEIGVGVVVHRVLFLFGCP